MRAVASAATFVVASLAAVAIAAVTAVPRSETSVVIRPLNVESAAERVDNSFDRLLVNVASAAAARVTSSAKSDAIALSAA